MFFAGIATSDAFRHIAASRKVCPVFRESPDPEQDHCQDDVKGLSSFDGRVLSSRSPPLESLP
jgi:hypothetical protein